MILELDPTEEKWWAETIKDFRNRFIKEPKFYASTILANKNISTKQLLENVDTILSQTREEVWQMYLRDEVVFHAEVLAFLFQNRKLPKTMLDTLLESGILQNTVVSKEEFSNSVSKLIGKYIGLVMPYIYELSLSTTQSRRSRSGKTFEHIIEAFMDIFRYPYQNQSQIATSNFSDSNLGKKVDLIVPGASEYLRNRSKCAVVTMKTTLRERWQEVAEELSRTNVPHIYLLTADTDITANVVNTMKQYNITLVVYVNEKLMKFSTFDNVQDFSRFFSVEMPHIINYWSK